MKDTNRVRVVSSRKTGVWSRDAPLSKGEPNSPKRQRARTCGQLCATESRKDERCFELEFYHAESDIPQLDDNLDTRSTFYGRYITSASTFTGCQKIMLRALRESQSGPILPTAENPK